MICLRITRLTVREHKLIPKAMFLRHSKQVVLKKAQNGKHPGQALQVLGTGPQAARPPTNPFSQPQNCRVSGQNSTQVLEQNTAEAAPAEA